MHLEGEFLYGASLQFIFLFAPYLVYAFALYTFCMPLYAFVLYAFVSTQKKNTYTFFPLSVSDNTDDDSIIIIVWARNSNVPFGFSFVSRSLVIRLTPFLWLWMRKKQLDNNIHQTDLWIILIELILQASNFCLNIFTN